MAKRSENQGLFGLETPAKPQGPVECLGIQNRTPFEWLAYLTEEVGELGKAISEAHYRNGHWAEVKREAIQVATLALKIAEMAISAVEETHIGDPD